MNTNYMLTIAGSKGGVGKTTTSINVGACFANAGYSTVVVEADLPMANLIDFVSLDIDLSEDETLHDVLAGDASIIDAVYEVEDLLAVVPSGTDVEKYAELEVDRLEEALDHLWWHYDIIILDTPAGMGQEVLVPMELADEVVLISTPRVSSVRNTRNAKAFAKRVGADVRGLVLTKSGTGASPGAERIAEFLDLDLLGHVPEDDAVPHSQDRGEPVVEYAPNSGPAIAYGKIAARLIDNVELDHERGPERPQSVDEESGPETESEASDSESGEVASESTDEGGSDAIVSTHPALGSPPTGPPPRLENGSQPTPDGGDGTAHVDRVGPTSAGDVSEGRGENGRSTERTPPERTADADSRVDSTAGAPRDEFDPTTEGGSDRPIDEGEDTTEAGSEDGSKTESEEAPEGHVEEAPEGHVEEAPEGHVEEAPDGHVEEAPDGHVEEAPDGHVEESPDEHVEGSDTTTDGRSDDSADERAHASTGGQAESDDQAGTTDSEQTEEANLSLFGRLRSAIGR